MPIVRTHKLARPVRPVLMPMPASVMIGGRRSRMAQCAEAAQGTVGAVVTCHNYGRFLHQCLTSLRAQTQPFDRVVIVDDASEDDTSVVASKYTDLPGWSYLRVDYRDGPQARNRGVAEIMTDFIAQVDADNWLEPTFVERLMPVFSSARVGVAYPQLKLVGPDGEFRGLGHAKVFDYDDLRRQNTIDTCAISRRLCHEDVGGWKSVVRLDDWCYHMEVSRSGWELAFVDEPLVNYRQHSAAMSTLRAGYDREDRLAAMAAAFELAVVTPFCGRDWALPKWEAAVKGLGWPADRLRIVVIDNSGKKQFGQKLRAALNRIPARAKTFVDLPTEHVKGMSAQALADDEQARTDFPAATSVALVPIWNEASKHLGTADVILTIEDDVTPPDGAVMTLLSELWPDVGAVAGLVRLRFRDCPYLLTEITSQCPMETRQLPAPDYGDVVEADVCGFGLTLWRRQVWNEIRARVQPDWQYDNRYPWYDYAWCKDMKLLGWRLLVHGSVRAKHWRNAREAVE